MLHNEVTLIKSRKPLGPKLPELNVCPFTIKNTQTSEYKDFLKMYSFFLIPYYFFTLNFFHL